MMLPKVLLQQFVDFVKTDMGLHITLHDKPNCFGEIGRFMLNDSLVVIRSFSSEAAEDATSWEVWTSQQLLRDELERNWSLHLMVTNPELGEDS